MAVFVTGATAPPSKPSRAQSAAQQQQSHPDQRGTEASPLIVETFPKAPTNTEAKKREEAEKVKSESDRKLVEFTGNLVLYTGGLFFATLALAIGTGALVWVGFRQVRDAQGSIDAALKSAEVAEKSLRIAQRPTINITPLNLVDAAYPDMPEARIEFGLRNNGVGAATISNVSVVAYISPSAINNKITSIPINLATSINSTILEVGESIGDNKIFGTEFPVKNSIFSILNCTLFIKLTFFIEFMDIVENKYTTETMITYDAKTAQFIRDSVKITHKQDRG